MSIEYCNICDKHYDTDFETTSEHANNGCCSMSPECECDDCEKENVKMD